MAFTDNITVVPEDRVILVNKDPLWFDYQSEPNLWALQWTAGSGHIEFNDASPNQMLDGQADYDQYVAPYRALWDAEKNKPAGALERLPTLVEGEQ